MDLSVQFLGDASKNCIAWVRGQAVLGDAFKPVEFLCLDQMSAAATGRRPKSLQVHSALWTLQEKLGIYVWTSKERKPENLLFVMESRNSIRFEREVHLDKWEGKLYLEPFNFDEPKRFWFQFDFDKVFER